MVKIPIEVWTAQRPKGRELDENGLPVMEDAEENTVQILSFLLNNVDQRTIPTGFSQFRIFNKISKAFDKVEKALPKANGKKIFLELGGAEYLFLKGLIDKNIPAQWGANENISKAVEAFMGASKDKGSKKKGKEIQEA